MTNTTFKLNPELDLMLERFVDVPHHLVWEAWTNPDQLKKWFCPSPWQTTACEINLQPGGAFRTTMRSPEGQEFPNEGCYLEIIKNKKLVWTSALESDYRPANRPTENKDLECATLLFTAMILLEPQANGTKYKAIAMHADKTSKLKHEKMGFHEGWGVALDQLVAMIKKM